MLVLPPPGIHPDKNENGLLIQRSHKALDGVDEKSGKEFCFHKDSCLWRWGREGVAGHLQLEAECWYFHAVMSCNCLYQEIRSPAEPIFFSTESLGVSSSLTVCISAPITPQHLKASIASCSSSVLLRLVSWFSSRAMP